MVIVVVVVAVVVHAFASHVSVGGTNASEARLLAGQRHSTRSVHGDVESFGHCEIESARHVHLDDG